MMERVVLARHANAILRPHMLRRHYDTLLESMLGSRPASRSPLRSVGHTRKSMIRNRKDLPTTRGPSEPS
jgi:hypothetical protein